MLLLYIFSHFFFLLIFLTSCQCCILCMYNNCSCIFKSFYHTTKKGLNIENVAMKGRVKKRRKKNSQIHIFFPIQPCFLGGEKSQFFFMLFSYFSFYIFYKLYIFSLAFFSFSAFDCFTPKSKLLKFFYSLYTLIPVIFLIGSHFLITFHFLFEKKNSHCFSLKNN